MWGDYILQTDRMAKLKTQHIEWALLHGALYTLPFILLTRSPAVLLVICFSHAIIDRYRLARYVVMAKNSLTDWKDRAKFKTLTGYANEYPCTQAMMVVLPLNTILLIAADNTIHLTINYAALRWM